MIEVILYPTETLYALGVNALDPKAVAALLSLKGRQPTKTASWLVPSIDDIHRYAIMTDLGARIAERFLPGQLTLILQSKDTIPREVVAPDGTIGFRITNDKVGQDVISTFVQEHDAPLTCTSANVSGSPTLPTPSEILQQFGKKAGKITRIVDDGPRKGLASTVVRVDGDSVKVLREGVITEREIRAAIA